MDAVLSAKLTDLDRLTNQLRAAEADRQSLAVAMARGMGWLKIADERARDLLQTVRPLPVLLSTLTVACIDHLWGTRHLHPGFGMIAV